MGSTREVTSRLRAGSEQAAATAAAAVHAPPAGATPLRQQGTVAAVVESQTRRSINRNVLLAHFIVNLSFVWPSKPWLHKS